MASPTVNVQPIDRSEGPFVLQPWVDSVPLSADGTDGDIKINCVEYFDGNLYVGTSAAELLHFVSIPPDPSDPSGRPVFIPASRLSPAFAENTTSRPGVQQILLLPRVGKACILCNGTVTFYSLPELSPVFGTKQVKNCGWIGGVDLNEEGLGDGATNTGETVTALLSLNRRIQVVRIDEDVRAVKNIDFAGSTLSVRRDSIACVADSKTYALLDVDRQLKIPLMNMSSLEESSNSAEFGHVQDIAKGAGGRRTTGPSRDSPAPDSRGTSPRPPASQALSPPGQPSSPRPPEEHSSTPPPVDKPLPAPPPPSSPAPQVVTVFLKPHIASPTPEEFLLVMGTTPSEPGVGMFVNLDGDPTRPTITFDIYPELVVVDGNSSGASSSEDEDGYVFASMTKDVQGVPRSGVEIQSWSAGNEAHPEKQWLEADDASLSGRYGIRALTNSQETQSDEVVEKLSMKKFIPFPSSAEFSAPRSPTLKPSNSRTTLSIEQLSKEKELFERDADSQDGEPLPEGWEAARITEGEEFARRLAKSKTRVAVWRGNRIWWAVRNPLIVQLDKRLEIARQAAYNDKQDIDKRAIIMVLSAIRDREPKTELEFTTFGYIQQKAGVILLINLLLSAPDTEFSDDELNALQEVLVDSKLDPRVVLSLIPGVRNEIIEGRQGIWVYGGVKESPEAFLASPAFQTLYQEGIRGLPLKTLHFLRRYLHAWRKLKGFGSVLVEAEVFRTVDAALLLVLLELDRHSPKGLGKGGAVRAEIGALVDGGIDCLDRAVSLLESYHRFFALSRLYHSRKMSADVLATWKRVLEGEEDDAQELVDGEQRVRDYLAKISNQELVQEYGLWLANRNPRLGVQVFAEDKGKAPKFEPAKAVELLRAEAPGAVRYYLEHLVFDKGYETYVNELISYYLEVVMDDLKLDESRERVLAAYDAYRALQNPKPTYRHFLTENAPENDEVWQSRLRLLQLLGGPHEYDVAAIIERTDKLSGDLLVPEAIILAGRERKHEEALRLLVHKLGDYDTAVSYCLRGGATIYSPMQGRRDSVPEMEQQRRLFQVVFREFLAIDDVSDRVGQTSALLDRFGGWFEIDDVLALIPDRWSVDIVAGFLVGAIRKLVQEKNEAMMKRALSGTENLRVSYDLVVKIGEKGPKIEEAPSQE
ncbi:transforming growth factor-beta receptor-associated protein 1 [Trichoderma asperellum]|uniref:Transforming growth factor-beta receptor-associated protein 1 n=1 Tax=Trichoderma asperellum TaxID=101201 RepID=A0A6V8R400_TRIAP|nr:transforming growth factor-beta receptor-associated protein 1 [Trichoderma asperellum]